MSSTYNAISDVDKWIMENTQEDDLIIGADAYKWRLHTRRNVLHDCYPEHPKLTEAAIADFATRFSEKIKDSYLVCVESDALNRSMSKYPIVFIGAQGIVIRRLELIKAYQTNNAEKL